MDTAFVRENPPPNLAGYKVQYLSSLVKGVKSPLTVLVDVMTEIVESLKIHCFGWHMILGGCVQVPNVETGFQNYSEKYPFNTLCKETFILKWFHMT